MIQHYVIKFVSDLRQFSGSLQVLLFSATNKTDRHDITELLWKEALNTITLTLYYIHCSLYTRQWLRHGTVCSVHYPGYQL
jgi:hypothetical protein